MQRPFVTDAYAVEVQARRYADRVAIVTGAAQGLGRVVARRLAEEGAAGIVLADLQRDRLARVARELAADTGATVLPAAGDLSTPGVAEEMAALETTR